MREGPRRRDCWHSRSVTRVVPSACRSMRYCPRLPENTAVSVPVPPVMVSFPPPPTKTSLATVPPIVSLAASPSAGAFVNRFASGTSTFESVAMRVPRSHKENAVMVPLVSTGGMALV